jgi:hypothetical protein
MYFGLDDTIVGLVDVQTSAVFCEAIFPWVLGWERKVIPVIEASEMPTMVQKMHAWQDRVLGGWRGFRTWRVATVALSRCRWAV